MTTVTFGIASRADVIRHAKTAAHGRAQPGARITFPSQEIMHRVLTPNRWRVLQAMMSAGPIGTRELARRLERDVKSMHIDVQALLKAGIIDRAADDKVLFPYDAAHVDFTVKAA